VEAIHATHAVVDERDGYTWVNDGHGLMDQAAAEAMAARYNEACKAEAQTYAVYQLVPVKAAPALAGPCPECGGGCQLDQPDPYVGTQLPHRATCSKAAQR
jgi:hypothetical protein